MTPVTKTTYVDNADSEMQGYIEVGFREKKAFIKKGTLEIINRDNIPLNLQAMAVGITIADLDNCFERSVFGNIHRTYHKPMSIEQAKSYIRKLKDKQIA